MNINLWNYNKWDRRKSKTIKFIRKHNPDIITFQEIREDSRRNKRGDNQLKQLNRILKYPYVRFYETMDVNSVNKALKDPKYDPSNPRVREGIGVLSKFKITRSQGRRLKQHSRDKYTRGILLTRIKADKEFDVLVVHFTANDLFSKLHLQETLAFVKKNRITPIIIGDFNIRKPKILRKIASKKYILSIDKYKYYSYPRKKENLDYILIPKNYKFKSFKCVGNISDHKALIAEIES